MRLHKVSEWVSEHLFEAGELLDMVKYNAERYETLINNFLCSCVNQPSSSQTQLDMSPPVLALPLETYVKIPKNECISFLMN